jgi:uncharacterized protein YjbI with pentapeptide repeats
MNWRRLSPEQRRSGARFARLPEQSLRSRFTVARGGVLIERGLSTCLGSNLGSADLGSAALGSADLGSADLGSADLGSAARGMVDQAKANLFSLQQSPQCNISVCQRSYRSFRDSDCTYQPSRGGPRRVCHR